MAYAFTLCAVIPATPKDIYDAWLDGQRHSAMTGGKATASAAVGATFTAWDGYISGRNLQLVPSRRIVQAWRTTQFADAQPDSIITVILAPVAGGTRLTLTHSNVPDDHKGYENGGWQTHYFDPMRKYFGRAKAPTPKKVSAKKLRRARSGSRKVKPAMAAKTGAKPTAAKRKSAKAKRAKAARKK